MEHPVKVCRWWRHTAFFDESRSLVDGGNSNEHAGSDFQAALRIIQGMNDLSDTSRAAQLIPMYATCDEKHGSRFATGKNPFFNFYTHKSFLVLSYYTAGGAGMDKIFLIAK
jgi:hypothetical protein